MGVIFKNSVESRGYICYLKEKLIENLFVMILHEKKNKIFHTSSPFCKTDNEKVWVFSMSLMNSNL